MTILRYISTPPQASVDIAKIWTEAEALYACNHRHSEVAYKVARNGHVRYYRQCIQCGRVEDLKKSDLNDSQMKAAAEVDESLSKAHYELKRTWADARREAIEKASNQDWERWYGEYMRSTTWKEKRHRVFLRCHGICEACGVEAATQVHHLRYDNVGREPLFDLVGVCASCHKDLHNG